MPQFDALSLDIASADSVDILRWLEAKGQPIEIGAWNEIGQAEYARAFTVAGTVRQNVVADIYRALLQTIQTGGTEDDFSRLVTPILREKGWLPGKGQTIGSRVQLIYDTNLRVSRAIGRWQRIQSTASAMPYLRATTVQDDRVRDEHRAFQGVVLPVGHWFWTEFFPPLYFRCRCDVVQLTRGQFRRQQLALTSEAEAQERAALIRPQSWGRNQAIVHQEVQQQLLADANAEAAPVAAPLDPQTLQAQGRSRWDAIMGLALQELLAGLVRAVS